MYSEPGVTTRVLLVTLKVENRDDVRFTLRPNEWPVENFTARSFPTTRYLKKLLEQVRSVKWVYQDQSRQSVSGIEEDADYPEELVIHPHLVAIEVRELIFKLDELTAETRTLSSYEEQW